MLENIRHLPSVALSADLIPRSKFATPGVNIGLFCSTPGVQLGRAVNRKLAMDMLLTGENFFSQVVLQFSSYQVRISFRYSDHSGVIR